MTLPWLSRDARLIILARGLRTFTQNYVAILLALYLDELGFSLFQIGAFLSVGAAGVAFFSFLVGLVTEKWGRRRSFIALTLMSATAGLAMFFVDGFVPLMLFAFVGSLTTGPGGGGGHSPIQPLEVASLPDTAPAQRRTDVFAILGIVARVCSALGALAAGLPALYQDALGLDTVASYKLMFVGFAAFQLIAAILYSLLSPAVEGVAAQRHWGNPLQLPSRRRIFTLSGVFSIDHFAGSLVMQSLVAYWFSTRFGIELGSLALVFFFTQILTAISFWIAAKLAGRIGLLNTMVFTHAPSNLFLIAVAFAPTAWVAVLFWLLRACLSHMDHPTRESYSMAVVGPAERVAMASVHAVTRSVSSTVGPSVATALWNLLWASSPLAASGILKLVYDAALYTLFRNVKPPEEAQQLRDWAAGEPAPLSDGSGPP